MYILVIILSIIIFIKSISYAVFEIKQNSNKIGGITIIAISVISLILPTVMVYVRGTY